MDTAVVTKLQQQVLTWDYFEMYEANKQSDTVKETLTRPPTTFSSPEASCRCADAESASYSTFIVGNGVSSLQQW